MHFRVIFKNITFEQLQMLTDLSAEKIFGNDYHPPIGVSSSIKDRNETKHQTICDMGFDFDDKCSAERFESKAREKVHTKSRMIEFDPNTQKKWSPFPQIPEISSP